MAVSREFINAQRRLARILDNETLGPALVRLPKGQQAEILGMIDAHVTHKSVAARILELDDARKSKRRARDWATEALNIMRPIGEQWAVGGVWDEGAWRRAIERWGDPSKDYRAVVITDEDKRMRRASAMAIKANADPDAGYFTPFWYHYQG